MFGGALRSSQALLKARLCFYIVSFVHLFTAAVVLLTIDMSSDPDPEVSAYIYIRWRLLTFWFNLITLIYFPISIYCDWMELKGQWDDVAITRLRTIKDMIMTCILVPTTLFCDILFWRVWHKNPSLIAPVAIFDYLPYWTHHSLHSFSGVTVVIDLLIVPRRRPDSLLPGLAVTTAFVTAYVIMITNSYMNGIAVYSILKIFDTIRILLLILMSYIEHYFYYTLQWCIVDFVWKNRLIKTKCT